MASANLVRAAADAAKGTLARFPWAASFPPSIDFDSRDDLRRAILVLIVKSLQADADEGVMTDTAVNQLITMAGNLGAVWDGRGKNEDLVRALIFSMMGPTTRPVGRQIRDWLLSNDPSWLTDAEERTLNGLREGKGVSVKPTDTRREAGTKSVGELAAGFWKDAEDTLYEIIGSGSDATIRVVSYQGRAVNKVYTAADAKWGQVRANLIADRMSGKLKRLSAAEASSAAAAATPPSRRSSFESAVKSTVANLPKESPGAPKPEGMRPELKRGLIIGGSIFGVAMLGLAAVLIFTSKGESDVPSES